MTPPPSLITQSRLELARRAAPRGPLFVAGAAGGQPRLADQRRGTPLQLEVRLRPHGRGGHGQRGQEVARRQRERRRAASLRARQPHPVRNVLELQYNAELLRSSFGLGVHFP